MEQIRLYSGAMFSGKSLNLILDYDCETGTKEVFKVGTDTRNKGYIFSRAIDKTVPCVTVEHIIDCLKTNVDHIFIDEFQFAHPEEMLEVIRACRKANKKLSIYGLDYLHNGEEWATYTAIKNEVDKEIKLKARCNVCGAAAEYTKLKSASDSLIQIESEFAEYFPVCAKHFK